MVDQIEKGFKQTEIGKIPIYWELKKLSEIGIFKKGKGLKKDDITTEGVPCVRYGEIYTRYNYFIKEFFSFIPPNLKNLSQRIMKGELLFTGSGETPEEIGKCIAFLDDVEAYAGGDVIIFTPRNQNSMYLSYLMYHNSVIKQKANMAQGDAVVHIYPKNLGQLVLPIPPTIEEQERIAKVLLDTDTLIGSLDRLIVKKKKIKQSAMQELLTGKKRLSGFKGSWVIKNISEVGKCFAGGTPSTFKSEYWGGDIIWLPSGRVQNNYIEKLPDEKTITKLGLENSATKLIHPKSVLMAITGATCGNIGLLEFEATANQSVVAIEPFVENYYKFLYYLLLNQRNNILSLQGGSAQGGINLSSVKKFKIILPRDKEEQIAIATILAGMDSEIVELERKRDKCKMLKVGLMQQLLTGRIRLKCLS